MSDCIFCRIAAKEIPSQTVYEDEQCVAFHDASPVAPVHVLVVPKAHYEDMTQVRDPALLGHLLDAASRVAVALGLEEGGFRLVINTGKDGGQTVPHLHLHVIGGRSLQWPPG